MGSSKISQALDFLDAIHENAAPEKRHMMNPILVGGGARLAAEAIREVLREWQEGAAIVENCLEVARRAQHEDAPFPMSPSEARIWHNARQEAFRHALEMMPLPSDLPRLR